MLQPEIATIRDLHFQMNTTLENVGQLKVKMMLQLILLLLSK